MYTNLTLNLSHFHKGRNKIFGP